jgi:membrane protease YdiL (CAAX protease family)
MSTPIATPAESAALPITRRATVPEMVLVLGLPTGLSFGRSLWWIAHHPGPPAFDDPRLVQGLIVEAMFAALLLTFLRRRGWRPSQVAGAPEPFDVLLGAGLYLAAIGSSYIGRIAFTTLAPAWAHAARAHPFTGHMSASMIVVASVLNAVFEEFLWLGYGISALGSRMDLRRASIVSIALRVSVHTYQRIWAIVSILPLSIVFTWYYARTRRIWPVIVAHTIIDALSFTMLTMAHR